MFASLLAATTHYMKYHVNDVNLTPNNLMSASFGGTEIALSCDEDTSLSPFMRVKVVSFFMANIFASYCEEI